MADIKPYDSTVDTMAHIHRVRELLGEVNAELVRREMNHDRSKLVPPEKEAFDRCTPLLAKTTYGTPEYEASKAELDRSGALQHHYAHNRHHPEFHPNGIHDMTLIDLIEMLADWKAAGERHDDGGNLDRSIRQNAGNFNYGASMISLLYNTARSLGWLN